MLYIFEVRIRQGHTAEEYAEAWERASRRLQRAPGALGTRLHRKIGDDRTLLAIARWDSKADRDAMEVTNDPVVAEIIREVSSCCEIRVLGEFEDAEWVVGPENPHTHADWGHSSERPTRGSEGLLL